MALLLRLHFYPHLLQLNILLLVVEALVDLITMPVVVVQEDLEPTQLLLFCHQPITR
jgi:hypothetical protein